MGRVIREEILGLFSQSMVLEQRRLMGFDDFRPTVLSRRAEYGFASRLAEAADDDAEVVDAGLRASDLAHAHSSTANNAQSWTPKLPDNYLRHVHTAARNAHRDAEKHWTHVAHNHPDPHMQRHAADLASEHGEKSSDHHKHLEKPKPEPEVYVRRKAV